MRFHIPGLAHTLTHKDFVACAFTMKVWKLCKMLTERGHTVYHYGVEGSNPVCTENVIVASQELRKKCIPDNWKQTTFTYNGDDELHQAFNANTIAEIHKRSQVHDFFLASWGYGHKAIADGVSDQCIVVEPGIGYDATFAKFRVFESYTWMNYIYGVQKLGDGSFYDAAIPNYFDPQDFTFREKKDDFFLYLGRIVKRKGVELAIQVAETLKKKLILAGQGPLKNEREGLDITESDYVEFVGYADVERRKDLLSRAKAVFCPTYYIEPFGGVTIESMMSGTPVITTDWGVFGENVLHGVTGYRCRTFEQFIWAAKNIDKIDPNTCRNWAIQNFSCDRVVRMFEEYFQMLSDLYTNQSGWYSPRPDRNEMDWLSKEYPAKIITTTIEKEVETPAKIPAELIQALTVKTDTKVKNLENEPGYELDYGWYSKQKSYGISFMIRARNEGSNIGKCLDSLAGLQVPHEINVFLNLCDDDTEIEVRKRQSAGMPINVFPYPFLIAKPGFEHLVTSPNSVHSLVWYYNYCLFKSNCLYTWKWDADFEMTPELKAEVESISWNKTMANVSFIVDAVAPDHVSREPNLWCNYLNPIYRKHYEYEYLDFFNKNVSKVSKLKSNIIHHCFGPGGGNKSHWNDPLWWTMPRSDSFYINKDPSNLKTRQKCAENYNKLIEIAQNHWRPADEAMWIPNKQKMLDAIGLPEFDEIKEINNKVIPKFSLMLMSRGRPEQLKNCMRSFYALAANPLNIEFLVRCDRDDESMKDFSFECPAQLYYGDRGEGIKDDYIIYNHMAKLATGNIFVSINDDIRCLTAFWDRTIAEEWMKWPDKIVCMFPDHSTHFNNCFSVFTKEWVDTVGHVAKGPVIDAWLSVIARHIGREVRIPVFIEHDHKFAVEKPENGDRTYAEGAWSEGYLKMAADVWTLNGKSDLRWEDITKLQNKINGHKEPEPEPENNFRTIVMPLENCQECALDLSWYDKPKPVGISFLMKAKNEEKTIGLAIDSLTQLKIPYEVNVILNQCTDGTEQEVRKRQEQGHPVHIYQYPYLIAKPGLQHAVTPANSVHSLTWMLNWCLSKANYKFTFKWDADFIMTKSLANELGSIVVTDADIIGGSAMYMDTQKDNYEPYMFSNDIHPRYVKYTCYESIAFGDDAGDVQLLKRVTLNSKIIHDSPLAVMKSYWQDPFWWDMEPSHPLASEVKAKYDKIQEMLGGMSLISRASCPESDNLWNTLSTIMPCRDDLASVRQCVFNLYDKTIRKRQILV